MRIEPLPEKLLDFRVFLTMAWRHLRLPDPTPVQLDIAYWLQHGPRRKVIEAFRGVGKSWITSAYVVWKGRTDPNRKFLVVSASKERADNFTTFTMRLISEMPVLQCLIPRRDQRNSKVSFDFGPSRPDHAPSVKSVGIFGQLAGSRADEIIADDIEVPNNSMTQLMRDKLSEAVKEFDAILKPDGRITYLGTPQTEQSLYNVLPERGYVTRIWPARFPKSQLQDVYGERLAPMIRIPLDEGNVQEGQPTDPQRFNETDLMEREASYGRSGFALQFMLDTRLADADRYPLKLSDLIVMDLSSHEAPEKVVWGRGQENVIEGLVCVGLNGDRYYQPMWKSDNWIEYKGSVMAVDPAGRGKDETAYAVVKMLNGQLFVTAAGGLQGGYSDDVLNKLAEIAREQKVNRMIIEANFGDGMFTQLLKPYLARIYPVTTEEVRHNIQKEKRIIDCLEPVMNQHRLIVDRKIIEQDYKSTIHLPPEQAMRYQLFYQMSRITRDRGALTQDDRLDALAIAVNYWTERMAQDVDKAVKSRKDDLLDKELAVFLGHAKGDMLDLACIAGVSGIDSGALTGRGSWIDLDF
jgi:hypothetical protein